MNQEEFLKKQEKNKMDFLKRQSEKNEYLGEYKERVIAALNKDQVIEDDLYMEIVESMKSKDAYMVKMAREINLKYLKPYIKMAEEIGIKYQLVDGISYMGNIGLVVISKEALDEKKEDVVIRDMDQDFIDVGLGESFSKNRGKKICSECYEKVKEKLPEYLDQFEKLNFFDKILGIRCPICNKEYKKQELNIRRIKK